MRGNRRIVLCAAGGMILLCLIYYIEISHMCVEGNQLLINEVCSNNFSTGVKDQYEDCDWIELYNPTNETIFLGDYYLSDDRKSLNKSKLPDQYLDAGEYFIVYAKGEEGNQEFDLNFRISSKGEILYLSKGDQMIDQAEIPALETNVTWSRMEEEWAKTQSTAGLSNQGAVVISDKQVEPPCFSKQGGFYNEKFFLEIDGNGEIFYTLDGSEPDCNSFKYTGPIEIKNISTNPNAHSMRTDLSTVSQFIPDELIDKVVTIRAVCADEKGNLSDTVTNSYLVGHQEESAYREVYTISLVTDPDNLFDYEEGIYVLGKDYDEYMLEDGSKEDDFWIPANYRRRGKKSEREGHIEIWDENGKEMLKRQIGMRIHGSTTRGSLQKSFSIYAREMYDEKGIFDEDIFGQGEEIRKFFIYSDRDDSKLKHILSQRLIVDRAVETQEFIRCNVFLNGEYWGLYSLAEVYDEYYFQNNYGIEKDSVEIHEGSTPDSITEFLSSNADLSPDQLYEELSELIDMQSFIDYYGSMIYMDDWDWLPGNARCWRSITKGMHEKQDGKWRWCVWDMEGAMNAYDRNTFQSGNEMCWENDPVVKELMKSEKFRKDFVISFMDMVNHNFEETHVLMEIDEALSEYEASYELNKVRYFENRETGKYFDAVKEFFVNRKDKAITYLKEEFDLLSDPVYFVLLCDKENAAEFHINTLAMDKDCVFWQGLYFNDYPVTLSVDKIESGEQFLGWYSDSGELLSTELEIEIEMGNETKVVHAKFAE